MSVDVRSRMAELAHRLAQGSSAGQGTGDPHTVVCPLDPLQRVHESQLVKYIETVHIHDPLSLAAGAMHATPNATFSMPPPSPAGSFQNPAPSHDAPPVQRQRQEQQQQQQQQQAVPPSPALSSASAGMQGMAVPPPPAGPPPGHQQQQYHQHQQEAVQEPQSSRYLPHSEREDDPYTVHVSHSRNSRVDLVALKRFLSRHGEITQLNPMAAKSCFFVQFADPASVREIVDGLRMATVEGTNLWFNFAKKRLPRLSASERNMLNAGGASSSDALPPLAAPDTSVPPPPPAGPPPFLSEGGAPPPPPGPPPHLQDQLQPPPPPAGPPPHLRQEQQAPPPPPAGPPPNRPPQMNVVTDPSAVQVHRHPAFTIAPTMAVTEEQLRRVIGGDDNSVVWTRTPRGATICDFFDGQSAAAAARAVLAAYPGTKIIMH